MRTVEHTVTHLIVHTLSKDAGTPARLALRDTACALDAAALRLVERLSAQYESRSAKGFGRFEDDEEGFPLARWLREHLVRRDARLRRPVAAACRARAGDRR